MQPSAMPPIMSSILSVSISPLGLAGSYVNVACKGFSPNLIKEQFNTDQYGAPRKCLKGSGLLPASSVIRYSIDSGNIMFHISGVVPVMMNSRHSASRKGNASWIAYPDRQLSSPRRMSVMLTRPKAISVPRFLCQACRVPSMLIVKVQGLWIIVFLLVEGAESGNEQENNVTSEKHIDHVRESPNRLRKTSSEQSRQPVGSFRSLGSNRRRCAYAS